MTRERLENLSYEELRLFATREKIIFPEDIEKDALIDLIQEILDEMMQERNELNNPSIRVEELKYHISQDEEIEVHEDEEIAIPGMYNKTRIILMPRDPYWAFAYWEIEIKKLETIQTHPEFGGLFIRVHDVKFIDFDGKNSNYFFDIPIQVTDNNWYINVPHPDSYYLLELYYLEKGQFNLLARSNVANIPRDKMVPPEPGQEQNKTVKSAEIIELTSQELFRSPSSWGPIPQRIISFINLKYLRQNE